MTSRSKPDQRQAGPPPHVPAARDHERPSGTASWYSHLDLARNAETPEGTTDYELVILASIARFRTAAEIDQTLRP